MILVENLRASCEDIVVSDMTRGLVRGSTPQERHSHWMELRLNPYVRKAAIDKINEMSNTELLDLIGEVLVNV